MADEIDVSGNAISLLERGKTFVSIPKLFEICEKLEISFFDVFTDTSIVNTRASKEFVKQYNQLSATNKNIVSGILTVFIKNQRVSEKNEKFNQKNKDVYFQKDKYEENAKESIDDYIDSFFDKEEY